MEKPPLEITDAELSVVQVLWDKGTATVREITELLYPKGTQSLIATVQKLLERLEKKQCVTRNRETWPHLFCASVPREQVIAHQLQSTANKLCDGEIHPLLTSLVKTRGLTPEDRKSLRGLLDELDQANH